MKKLEDLNVIIQILFLLTKSINMKRTHLYFLSFVFSLCFATKSLAQVQLYLSAGPNYSTVSFNELGESLFDPGYFTGYHVELNAKKSLTKRLAFNVSLQYSTRGYTPNMNTSYSALRRKYLDIQAEVSFISIAGINAGAGLYAGLVSSVDAKDNSNWRKLLNGNFKELGEVGLSLLLQKRINKLVTYFRYKQGFPNILEINYSDQNGQALGDLDEKSSLFQIGIGYVFR